MITTKTRRTLALIERATKKLHEARVEIYRLKATHRAGLYAPMVQSRFQRYVGEGMDPAKAMTHACYDFGV